MDEYIKARVQAVVRVEPGLDSRSIAKKIGMTENIVELALRALETEGRIENRKESKK